MSLLLQSKLLRVLLLTLPIFLVGCDSEPAKDFSFVEDSIFPLPVDTWDDDKGEYSRTIKFDCAFDVYAAWLVNLQGYRETIGIDSDDDAKKALSEIVEHLERKEPGEGYQGMHVGVEWLEEHGTPLFAIQISSHVSQHHVVSVNIVCSQL